MTARPPRSPRLLLIATMILLVAGTVLLAMPAKPEPGAPSAPSRRGATITSGHPAPTASSSPGGGPAADGPPSENGPAAPSAPLASALPPRGEGVAGDRAIQQALEAAWPADLDGLDERRLLRAGRELLKADATGIGRARWPAYFAPDQAFAPAFATARFRIQAAIARRDGAPGRAVVHLVWAGTDRGGTYADGRITDLYFTRTSVTKEGSAWTPHPRT